MGTCDAESVVETFLKTTVETKKIEQGVLRDLRKNVCLAMPCVLCSQRVCPLVAR